MTTGILEGAGLMWGVSITTLIITKIKCYYKQNLETRWGCVFTDKSLIDDDETEIKTVTVDDTTVFYVSKNITKIKNKHNLLYTIYVFKC